MGLNSKGLVNWFGRLLLLQSVWKARNAYKFEGKIDLLMSSSSVNGSSSNRLTYVNINCRRCNKKATIRISESHRNKNKLFYSCNDCGCFVGWCLPTNSEYGGHQIPREEVPPVGEQVMTEQLRVMTEQQREMTEQLQIHRAKMQKLIYIYIYIYILSVLLVICALTLIKM
ncbi:unnamed protein product [Camellia sinensis]